MSAEKERVFGGIKTTAEVHDWCFDNKKAKVIARERVEARIQGEARAAVKEHAARTAANKKMGNRDRALSAMLSELLPPEKKAKR